jgi:hypothetical protein
MDAHVPIIHGLAMLMKDVDGRDKPDHDGGALADQTPHM